VHFHAALRALGQRFGERLADLARPVDISLERDGLLRRTDRFEHRREDAIAVEQRLDLVARRERGTEQHTDRTNELRVVDRVLVPHLLLDFLLGRDEIHRDERHRECRDDRHRDIQRPAFSILFLHGMRF
jgi:hypothetical protein